LSYRKLKQDEIDFLKNNGCNASDWQLINVVPNFSKDNIKNVAFSGEIFLGDFKGEFELYPGLNCQFGLYNSTIHSCKIADKVYIKDVKFLMNYDIEENVVIINSERISVSGESTFGNGTEIEVLNEGGGRELKIFDQLSSQIAYMLVAYHHTPKFIKNLNNFVDKYVESVKSNKGCIAKNTRIENCKQIQNVKIGPYSNIYSVLSINNGTIASVKEAPVTIGEGVIANNFIIQSGSVVDSSAILNDCFIGQSVQIGKQFSAENSAFFANCEGFHGEACSVFAGPYSVTHHKSTLLIAGMYSFYNAGSGTNQSNHMYKLGPVHQGIMERGAKTGSFSYLLWPSRIGAFSVVVGKHYSNFDTALLPFSYIVESGGKSLISPAMNLFTVGTSRDSRKWKKRDKRTDTIKYDLIHFDLYNPYTIGKIVAGMDVLKSLYEKAEKKQNFVMYNGINIKRLMLKTCRNYYDMALKIYLGDLLVDRLKKMGDNVNFADLKQQLTISSINYEDWIDLAGLLAPKNEIDNLIFSVEKEEFNTIVDISEYLQNLYNKYDELSFSWTIGLIEKILNIKISDFSEEHLLQIITDWQKNSTKLNNMIVNDANKEFDSKSQIGYGIDGDSEMRLKDFEEVRGTFEENSFVKEIQSESDAINITATDLLNKLQLSE
jgi:uncharacterized protein DUF4954/uncharacterized protein DUF6819